MNIKSFPELTRRELEAAFRDAFTRARPEAGAVDADEEADIFIGGLEKLAELDDFRKEREPQQRRRERVEALANAVDRCVEAALHMDDASLGYALWRGLGEVVKHPDLPEEARADVQALEGRPICLLAYELKMHRAAELRNFALGVRKAIKDLPALDAASYSFEEQTARWIEDYLARLDVSVSQSDTGLAGKAFHAVMELAGKPQGTAKNWLGKVQRRPDTFVNFLRGLKARFWH